MRSGINNDKVIVVKAAVAAGQTAVNSDPVDMSGWESVEFIVVWGAITGSGVQSVKAQQDTVIGMGTAADLLGTSISVADDADGKATRLEIIRPEERFVRCVVSRATQDSVVSAIIAILRSGRKAPITQDATIQGSEVHVSPIEGTA